MNKSYWHAGSVSSLAGSGEKNFNDGPGPRASFDSPMDVAVAGNDILVSDCTGLIRCINLRGEVSTLAGVKFNHPTGLAVTEDGVLYVADTNNHRIQKILYFGGERPAEMSTVAGSVPGLKDGSPSQACFKYPWGLALANDGSLVVADSGNDKIRRVSAKGVTTLELRGEGSEAFSCPLAVTVGSNGHFMATNRDGHLCSISPQGVVSIVATGLGAPGGLLVDCRGNAIVADSGKHRIMFFSPDGEATVIAGDGQKAFKDGASGEASFCVPYGLAMDQQGRVIVSDSGNHRVRALTLPSTLQLQRELSNLSLSPSSVVAAVSRSARSLFYWGVALSLDEESVSLNLSLEMPFNYPLGAPLIKVIWGSTSHPQVDAETGEVRGIVWEEGKASIAGALHAVRSMLSRTKLPSELSVDTAAALRDGSVEFWGRALVGVLDEDDIAEAASKLSAAGFKQKHVGELAREDLKDAGLRQGVIKDFLNKQHLISSEIGIPSRKPMQSFLETKVAQVSDKISLQLKMEQIRSRELQEQVAKLTSQLEEATKQGFTPQIFARSKPSNVRPQQDSSTIMFGDVVSLVKAESLKRFPEFLGLEVLKELYEMEQAPADWHAVRSRIVLKPISTWDPISMHLANEYFKRNQHKRHVGFLNCGRGRVRYQLYEKDPQNHNRVALREDRPGHNEEEGAELDKLQCGSYQPEVVVGANTLKGQLAKEMKDAPWANLEEPIDVYGFVAGQIRDEAEFRVLRLALTELFPQSVQPVTALLGPSLFGLRSYSLSPQDEGKCLIEGARAVYQQMRDNPEEKQEAIRLVPIASLKIGPDTAQWAQHGAEPFTFLGGGISPAAVVGLGIVKCYRRNPEQFQALCDMIRAPGKDLPVIALWPSWGPQFVRECQAFLGKSSDTRSEARTSELGKETKRGHEQLRPLQRLQAEIDPERVSIPSWNERMGNFPIVRGLPDPLEDVVPFAPNRDLSRQWKTSEDISDRIEEPADLGPEIERSITRLKMAGFSLNEGPGGEESVVSIRVPPVRGHRPPPPPDEWSNLPDLLD